MRRTLAAFAFVTFAGCVVGQQELQSREATLRSRCPLGTPFKQVLEVVSEYEQTRFIVLSPSQCQELYVEILRQPAACAGGSRVDVRFPIAKRIFAFETELDVTYLFDANEHLAVAEYTPFYVGL